MTLKWRAKGSRIRTLTRAFTSGDAEEAAFAARSVADLRTERRRPSARLTTRKDGPRADRSDTTGSRWPASAWWGSTMVTSGTIPSKTGAFRSVRGRQNDDGTARSSHPPLRDHRNRQRVLALQEPRLTDPIGLPRWANEQPPTHAVSSLVGAPRRAGPSCSLPGQALQRRSRGVPFACR